MANVIRYFLGGVLILIALYRWIQPILPSGLDSLELVIPFVTFVVGFFIIALAPKKMAMPPKRLKKFVFVGSVVILVSIVQFLDYFEVTASFFDASATSLALSFILVILGILLIIFRAGFAGRPVTF
jgi:small-conductance mechanosensitive channel